MDSLNFNSAETLPGCEARDAFTINSSSLVKGDVDIVPTIIDSGLSYTPWGGDKPNTIKFTWRYVDNRPIVRISASRGIFTSPFDYRYS